MCNGIVLKVNSMYMHEFRIRLASCIMLVTSAVMACIISMQQQAITSLTPTNLMHVERRYPNKDV